jgi:hypothetical protein
MNTLFVFRIFRNWYWDIFDGFGFFNGAFAIAAYILFSIGLYRLARNQNNPNAWLAWIPLLQLYIIGKIVGEVSLGSQKITRLDIIMPVSPLIVGVLYSVPFFGAMIGSLASMALVVFFLYVLYHLYKMYAPESAVLYTILSIVVAPIMIFIIRDKKQVVA